jgi:hypothetical protein
MALRWRYVVVIGAVSLLTMPITAIWFLVLGFAALTGTAVAAGAHLTRTAESLDTGISIGVGLLVGPVVYLSLALIT